MVLQQAALERQLKKEIRRRVRAENENQKNRDDMRTIQGNFRLSTFLTRARTESVNSPTPFLKHFLDELFLLSVISQIT